MEHTDNTTNGHSERIHGLPTVDQVLARKFVKSNGYQFSSALLALGSPLAPIVAQARQASRFISLTDQVTDTQVNQTLKVLEKVTGNPTDMYLIKPHSDNEAIDDPDQKRYYADQLEQTIEILHEQGYLPDLLRDLISSRLIIPGNIRLVKGDLSDFTYRNILIPEAPITLNVSPKHVQYNINRLKQYLEAAGLTNKLSDTEIRSLGTQTALAHELGHAIDTGLIILLAANVLNIKPPFNELKIKRLDEESEEKAWNAVSKKTKELLEIAGDNRIQTFSSDFEEGDMQETLIEGIAVSVELALIDAVIKKNMWNEQEQGRLFDAIRGYFSHGVEDYLYFTNLIKNQGLMRGQGLFDRSYGYQSVSSATGRAFENRGYHIDNLLPLGPNGKAFGYNLPILPSSFRNYVNTFSMI